MERALSEDIEEVIDGVCWYVPRPANATYLDDVTVGHWDVTEAWKQTLYAIVCLSLKGLPLGASKCNWLTRKVAVLGVELVRDEYHIGKKALAKFVAGGLPRTLS